MKNITKNILISLFVFLFTTGITIYNFCRGVYVYGYIALVFAFIDLFILVFTILKALK